MKILIIVIATLIGIVVLVVGIGYTLPVKHRATRMAEFNVPPDSIFGIISNPAAYPEWRSKVQRVEDVAQPDGKRAYREIGSEDAILYVVEELTPNSRMITRIADDKLPFGGRWTTEVSPSANGTTVRITEDGEVFNPLFRFMSKFVFGHHATMEAYLKDLGRKCGHETTILP